MQQRRRVRRRGRQAERRIDQHERAGAIRKAQHKLGCSSCAEGMADDDGRRDALSRDQHVVDAFGLVLSRVAARTIGEAERRKIERDDVVAGACQRIGCRPPQLAPGRRAVEQHDGRACRGSFLLDEDVAGARCYPACPVVGARASRPAVSRAAAAIRNAATAATISNKTTRLSLAAPRRIIERSNGPRTDRREQSIATRAKVER